jgi:hypothetical protein
MTKFNDEFTNCEQETARDAIPEHHNDFKFLYNKRLEEINNAIELIQQRRQPNENQIVENRTSSLSQGEG